MVLKKIRCIGTHFSENLGHTSIATDEQYLGSFEDDKKIDLAKYLTAFRSAG